MSDDLQAQCTALLEAVLHDDNCINVHFPNSGRCCDCDRPQRQGAAMARVIEVAMRRLTIISRRTKPGVPPQEKPE